MFQPSLLLAGYAFFRIFWNLPFHYSLEEQLPWEGEGSSVVVQEGKPSEQARNAPRKADLRAPQPLGSYQAVQIPTAVKHTQLTVRLFNKDWEKKGRYVWEKLEGRKKRPCFPLSILIPFQPALSGVQTTSKQMNSWQWQLKHPVCQRQKRTVAQTKSVFTARCDPSGCLLRSMKAVLQQTSRVGHLSASLAGESRNTVLLALVQAAVLWLLNGVRGSGNVDDLMESLGSVLSTEKCENGRGFPRSRNSDWEPHNQWKNVQWLMTSGLSSQLLTVIYLV